MQFQNIILSISLLAFQASSVAANGRGWCKVKVLYRYNSREVQAMYAEIDKDTHWNLDGFPIVIKPDGDCKIKLVSGRVDHETYFFKGEAHKVTTYTK